MSNNLIVKLDRTNVIGLSMGMDVSSDSFASDIRIAPNKEAAKVASWVFSFLTDGTDGEIVFTLSKAAMDTTPITVDKGYMDVKRVSNGQPYQVNFDPIIVEFEKVITP